LRLPAELVIIVGVGQSGRILQDLPDAGHQLVEELAALGVVEQRPPDRGDLYEAREGQGRQRDRQRGVEVEEELQRAELEKRRTPTCRNLGNEVMIFLKYFRRTKL
jgi:hypothetical protein